MVLTRIIKKTPIGQQISVITMMYHGYEVEALPERDPKSNHWRVKLNIYNQRRGRRGSLPFECSESYLSQKEAIERCWEYGQKIIDGEMNGVSVNNL